MSVPPHSVHYLEIVTPDPVAAARLYTAAHGWRFEGPVPELGNAQLAELPDGSLCGIRAPMHAEEPPVVRAYVRVADLPGTVARAEAAGAFVALRTMEIPGRGTIAIIEHGGVQHGFWQVD